MTPQGNWACPQGYLCREWSVVETCKSKQGPFVKSKEMAAHISEPAPFSELPEIWLQRG